MQILGVDKTIVDKLMDGKFGVDIKFNSKELYDNAVSFGFNKEKWEQKNDNKVVIEN